jgi:hypothetical protein
MSIVEPAIELMNKKDKRLSLFTLGASLSQNFCENNNIPIPEYRIKELDSTGLYLPQTHTKNAQILVNLGVTANPVENPGHMRWSHPAWKTDRTAFGVVLHETGHHIDQILINKSLWGSYPSDRSSWLEVKKGKRISGYEPNSSEAFAETMRLFIGNPDLLKLAIPSRYNYLCQVLKLQPVVAMDYKTAIGNSNYFAAADKWITNK